MFQTNATHSIMPANFPALTTAKGLLEDGAAIQRQILNASSRLQIETLDFFLRRYEEQVKLIGNLIGSVEYNDALDAVGDFVRAAKIDYATEASRLATIGSRFAVETAKRIRDDAKSTVDEIAARTMV
jgi:hypothetical protein